MPLRADCSILVLLIVMVIIMMMMMTMWALGLSGCNAGVRVDAASRCCCSGGYDAVQSFENAAEISDRPAALCMQLGDLFSCIWFSRPPMMMVSLSSR